MAVAACGRTQEGVFALPVPFSPPLLPLPSLTRALTHIHACEQKVSGKDLEQLLADQNIPFRKVKRVVQKPFAFVTFNVSKPCAFEGQMARCVHACGVQDQDACDKAKAELEGVELKGCTVRRLWHMWRV